MLNYRSKISRMIALIHKMASHKLMYSQYYKIGSAVGNLPLRALTQKMISRLIISGHYRKAINRLQNYLA